MKIIEIKKLEALLGVEIHKNKVCLGSDTSVHSTGIALVSTDEEYVYLDYTNLIETPKDKSLVDNQYLFKLKLQEIMSDVGSIMDNLSINSRSLVIENTFYQRNAQVLIKLSRFGGMVFAILEGLFNDCEYPSPNEARGLVNFKKKGKEDIKLQIIGFVNILGFKVDQEDIADAIVLALSGLIVHILGKHCCVCGSKEKVTKNKKKKKYYCSKCAYKLKKYGKVIDKS